MITQRLVGRAIVAAITLAVISLGCSERRDKPVQRTGDPIVQAFHDAERACLTAYNDALAQQRTNRIDELELSNIIERDVLDPWRKLRARVTSAKIPPGREDMYATMQRYLETRQVSWEAYVTALRAPSDEAARPHLEVHRQKNEEAQTHARALANQLRELAL